MEAPDDRKEMVGVYGTLRAGGSNHFRMRGAEWIGTAKISGSLYRIDWYPGMVLGGDGEVRGEIYRVDARVLAELDDFEGVSADEEGGEYRRVRTPARLADGSLLKVWVWEWLGPCDEGMRIPSGDWLLAD